MRRLRYRAVQLKYNEVVDREVQMDEGQRAGSISGSSLCGG